MGGPISRRTLAMGAVGSVLVGCSGRGSSTGGSPPATISGGTANDGCKVADSLTTFSTIGDARIGYEVSGGLTSMQAEPAFLTMVTKWAAEWATASGLGSIKTIWSYGAWTNKCNSLHQVGRAFDIARIEHARGTVSCRYDTWRPGTSAQTTLYWRLAASLHRRFAYTICYPYNAEHANHIHIDNAVNKDAATTFDPASKVQVQLVQHVCTHVFGVRAPTDGVWNDETRKALRAVQRAKGITAPIGEAKGWSDFLTAAIRG